MIAGIDRRSEPRLNYSWDSQIYTEGTRGGRLGRMVDLNSKGAAFLVSNDTDLSLGGEIEMGIMYPRVVNGNFDIINDHLRGEVVRNDWYNSEMKRLVVEFHAPMEDHPAVGNEYIYQ